MKKLRILFASIAVVVIAASFLLSVGFAGWRSFFITSPSMGQAAPVGTLVITHSAPKYDINDVITFQVENRTYTHRIMGQNDDGYITKGDLNTANDPWSIKHEDIVGSVRFFGYNIGWIQRAMPWFLLSMVIVYSLSNLRRHLPKESWRWPVMIIGTTLVVSIISLWLRPWVNFEMIGFRPADEGGGVLMRLVNTGIFPIEAKGTRLISGQDGVVHVTEHNSYGFYELLPEPSLGWAWVIVAAICLLPMIISIILYYKRPESPSAQYKSSRWASAGTLIISLAVTGTIVFQLSSLAAIVASIDNSQNLTGSRTWFTCRAAISGTPGRLFGYAMGTTGTTETEIGSNGSNGTYSTSAATNTSIGCLRDTPQRSINFATRCLHQSTQRTNPTTFSLEAWFRTANTSNGKIIGFGNTTTSNSDASNDRMIYIDPAGRLIFATWPNTIRLIASPAGKSYADNTWHRVVVTFSPTTGASLYVDGNIVASDPTMNAAQNYNGYWKIGCGVGANWRAANGTTVYNIPQYFTGQLQYVAVYTVVLSAQQVKEHYQAGSL